MNKNRTKKDQKHEKIKKRVLSIGAISINTWMFFHYSFEFCCCPVLMNIYMVNSRCNQILNVRRMLSGGSGCHLIIIVIIVHYLLSTLCVVCGAICRYTNKISYRGRLYNKKQSTLQVKEVTNQILLNDSTIWRDSHNVYQLNNE